MSDVGSLAWARRTGGRLGFADRVTLARTAVVQLAKNTPALLAYRTGLKRAYPAAIDLESLAAPDSAAARDAERELEELTPPYMVNHSLRTYWFSRLMGEHEGLGYDDEVLYVASLLHDIGFFGEHAKSPPGAPCFAVRGGEAAAALAARHGWDPARCDRAAETISVHVNGSTGLEAGPEPYLMQKGVMVDVTGVNAWELNPSNVNEVFQRHPLLDQHRHLWPLFRDEARAHPDCRGFFAVRWLRFGLLVRSAPWS